MKQKSQVHEILMEVLFVSELCDIVEEYSHPLLLYASRDKQFFEVRRNSKIVLAVQLLNESGKLEHVLSGEVPIDIHEVLPLPPEAPARFSVRVVRHRRYLDVVFASSTIFIAIIRRTTEERSCRYKFFVNIWQKESKSSPQVGFMKILENS